MTLYVLTENSFLYAGFSQLFSQRFNKNCVRLTSKNMTTFFRHMAVQQEDIFIIASDSLLVSYSLLLYLNKYKARIFLIRNQFNERLIGDLSCNFLDKDLSISDIARAFLEKNKINDSLHLPELTDREKEILFYTLNGLSTPNISEHLNIAIKTVYSHQRNGLRKIGVRKVTDIIRLPAIGYEPTEGAGYEHYLNDCEADGYFDIDIYQTVKRSRQKQKHESLRPEQVNV